MSTLIALFFVFFFCTQVKRFWAAGRREEARSTSRRAKLFVKAGIAFYVGIVVCLVMFSIVRPHLVAKYNMNGKLSTTLPPPHCTSAYRKYIRHIGTMRDILTDFDKTLKDT